jgi:XRE family transcriptional regulator, fatty acid utilization regulator
VSVPLLDDSTGVRTTRLEPAATPEQARRASAELRERMRHRDNYFGEIEMAAADLLKATGYEDGPITRHVAERMAAHLGFRPHPHGDRPGPPDDLFATARSRPT